MLCNRFGNAIKVNKNQKQEQKTGESVLQSFHNNTKQTKSKLVIQRSHAQFINIQIVTQIMLLNCHSFRNPQCDEVSEHHIKTDLELFPKTNEQHLED